jgi:hypothetical protein
LIGIVGSIFHLVLIAWKAANLMLHVSSWFDSVVLSVRACRMADLLSPDRLLGMMQIETPTRRLF